MDLYDDIILNRENQTWRDAYIRFGGACYWTVVIVIVCLTILLIIVTGINSITCAINEEWCDEY